MHYWASMSYTHLYWWWLNAWLALTNDQLSEWVIKFNNQSSKFHSSDRLRQVKMTVGQVEYLQDLSDGRLRISDFHKSCIGFIYFRQVNGPFGQVIFTIPVFKISAGPRTLTDKICVGPASFPSLSYINFAKIVLRSGKFQILFWRLQSTCPTDKCIQFETSKPDNLSQTSDIEVHFIHVSHVIIIYTLEPLLSLT